MNHSKVNNDPSARWFIDSSGDPSTGLLPKVRNALGQINECEISLPPGYYALPSADDEVVVTNPFQDMSNRVITGVIPDYVFNIKVGDRLWFTDNAHIYLGQDGTVTVAALKGVNVVSGNGASIKINESGSITVIASGGATIQMNTDGTIDLN